MEESTKSEGPKEKNKEMEGETLVVGEEDEPLHQQQIICGGMCLFDSKVCLIVSRMLMNNLAIVLKSTGNQESVVNEKVCLKEKIKGQIEKMDKAKEKNCQNYHELELPLLETKYGYIFSSPAICHYLLLCHSCNSRLRNKSRDKIKTFTGINFADHSVAIPGSTAITTIEGTTVKSVGCWWCDGGFSPTVSTTAWDTIYWIRRTTRTLWKQTVQPDSLLWKLEKRLAEEEMTKGKQNSTVYNFSLSDIFLFCSVTACLRSLLPNIPSVNQFQHLKSFMRRIYVRLSPALLGTPGDGQSSPLSAFCIAAPLSFYRIGDTTFSNWWRSRHMYLEEWLMGNLNPPSLGSPLNVFQENKKFCRECNTYDACGRGGNYDAGSDCDNGDTPNYGNDINDSNAANALLKSVVPCIDKYINPFMLNGLNPLKYFITTAINYTNGMPHIGHAYEAIIADVFARYHRIVGRDVYFITGTDEHGQKIAKRAKSEGCEPMDICNFYCNKFQELNRKLCIEPDNFVRTSSKSHALVCCAIWKALESSGDIYRGQYCGWYNEREEAFVTLNDAQLMNFIDPVSGADLLQLEEESYMFKLSKYEEVITKRFAECDSSALPINRKNEILERLNSPLDDLSITRLTGSWGIPVPNDQKHIMYVWFDALINYLSGAKYPVKDDEEAFEIKQIFFDRYWPPDLQIIGKDIQWFHTVVWQSMLMSLNLGLPRTIFSHGFVEGADGRKMSKSLGNIVDPFDMLEKFDADTIRYYMMKDTKLGADLRFDLDNIIDVHNSDLADCLGNLVHRGISLCGKICDYKVPLVKVHYDEVPIDIIAFMQTIDSLFLSFQTQQAIELIMNSFRKLNKYLTDAAPWKVQGEEAKIIVKIVLELLYFLSHFLYPFVPNLCEEIFKKLNSKRKLISSLSCNFDNLTPGSLIELGSVLVEKKKTMTTKLLIQKVEMRLGKIIEVRTLEKNANFLCITFSLPEPLGNKLAVAEIAHLYKSEDLIGKRILIVCNFKSQKVVGLIPNCSIVAVVPTSTISENPSPASLNSIRSFSKIYFLDGGPVEHKNKPTVDSLNDSVVEACGYPYILRCRENVTRNDLNNLCSSLFVSNNQSIYYRDEKIPRVNEPVDIRNLPLIFAQSGDPVVVQNMPCTKNTYNDFRILFL